MTQELQNLVRQLEREGREQIMVTGPQRSGTRIAAKTLSLELRLPYVDEDDIGIDNEEEFAKLLRIAGPKRWVLHAPGLSHLLHRIERSLWPRSDTPDAMATVGIVWMIRPTIDVIASEDRIKWRTGNHHERERGKLRGEPNVAFFADDRPDDYPISCRKNAAWQQVQKPLLGDHAYELHYQALNRHPLWIPKDLRTGFTHDQTEI